jgi:hypothetical protein
MQAFKKLKSSHHGLKVYTLDMLRNHEGTTTLSPDLIIQTNEKHLEFHTYVLEKIGADHVADIFNHDKRIQPEGWKFFPMTTSSHFPLIVDFLITMAWSTFWTSLTKGLHPS